MRQIPNAPVALKLAAREAVKVGALARVPGQLVETAEDGTVQGQRALLLEEVREGEEVRGLGRWHRARRGRGEAWRVCWIDLD